MKTKNLRKIGKQLDAALTLIEGGLLSRKHAIPMLRSLTLKMIEELGGEAHVVEGGGSMEDAMRELMDKGFLQEVSPDGSVNTSGSLEQLFDEMRDGDKGRVIYSEKTERVELVVCPEHGIEAMRVTDGGGNSNILQRDDEESETQFTERALHAYKSEPVMSCRIKEALSELADARAQGRTPRA